MILTVFTWIGIGFAAFLIGLLVIPIRIFAKGSVDERRGLNYWFVVNWAFGVLSLRAITAGPVEIYLFGLRLGRIPLKFKKNKQSRSQEEKKKASSLAWLQWTRGNFSNINHILGRFARAGFLQGHLAGEIGLADPADTAMIGQLTRLVRIDSPRFKLFLTTVYAYETMDIKAQVRATLVIAYLGLVALGLFLDRRIRLMLRGLPQTR